MSLARDARMLEAATALANPRPQPMVTETFELFRLDDNGKMWPLPLDASTLEECQFEVAARGDRGEQFAVRQTSPEGIVLHVYQVRCKPRTYQQPPGEFLPRAVVPKYADRIAVMRADPAQPQSKPLIRSN